MRTSESAQAFERFVGDVRRYVRHRVADPSVHDDIVQEVFLRVHDRREQVLNDERLAGWIRRITANVVTDHYRKRPPPELLPTDIPAPPQGHDPIELDRALLGSWLAATVQQLEPHHREVLILTELQGLTQREAAARLGLSLPAVKARVRRGRAALMQRLQQCCHLDLDQRGALIGYSPKSACEAGRCCPTDD